LGNEADDVVRGHAQVAGRSRPGFVAVRFLAGADENIPSDIPRDIVPTDLQKQCCSFFVLFNKATKRIVGIEREPEQIVTGRAIVIGCLRPGFLTVNWFIGSDYTIPTEIPIDIVPFDLRMPNSRFTLLFDKTTQEAVGVDRQDRWARG
jgi:hypothetical protein